jgi:GNAT superfamily N-acetyltransferase
VVTVRRAVGADADQLAALFLRSFRWALPTVQLAHDDDDVHRWWREEVIPGKETWVAFDDDGPVGVLAMSASMVDALYLEPSSVGQGIGTRLLELAKAQRPAGLELYAFAVNERARRFYEARGFVAVAFGDGSANEEHEPDVLYRWSP